MRPGLDVLSDFCEQDLGAMEFLPRIALLVAVGNREIDFSEGGTGGGTWMLPAVLTRPGRSR